MQTLRVELGARGYPIYIGSGLLGQRDLIQPHLASKQALVVTNTTVAPLYLDQTLAGLEDRQVETVILPDGERYKTLEVVNSIFDALLEKRYDRRCTLVALGGGVVGDMTGFAAACYQRGVPFVQIPTTLLAQVDSSVGGKTGVNHRLGKNMIGAFHQPRCVIADTHTLQTLDDRELTAGIAEIIKYGLIRDPEFFTWLEENMPSLLDRNPASLASAIGRSCQNKAEVVAADELESGQRALLNLGHTFGHAIETGAGYGTWLHGHAVAVGMAMAGDLSVRLGWFTAQEQNRLLRLLQRTGLPSAPPGNITGDRLRELMAVDKKVQDGKLRLVLLKSIGDAVVTDDFDPVKLQSTLDEYGRA